MSEKTHRAEHELNAPGTREELSKLLAEFRTGILVTRDDGGMPRARPLAIAKHDADGSLWFATPDHTAKVEEIARDGNVGVICHRTRDEAWISISGRAQLVRDRAKIKELWDASMKAWFAGPTIPPSSSFALRPCTPSTTSRANRSSRARSSS
jgi:general stress protein 26